MRRHLRGFAFTFCLAALAASTRDAHAQDPTAPVTSYSTPAAPSGQAERGFVGEVRLGSQFTFLPTGGNTAGFQLGSFSGGILLGYKIDRFIFGLGFDIARVHDGNTTTNSMTGVRTDASAATTAIMFVPGVRVAILRSADQRVELFGMFDIGLGGVLTAQDPAPMMPPDRSTFRLSYNIAPGLRYWIHPQFALAAVAGVHGDFTSTTTSMTTGGVTINSTDSLTLTSIFGALQFTGVF